MNSHKRIALLFTALAALIVPTGVVSRAQATTTNLPASIAADCSRPVDAEINAFINTVPDGSTVLFGQGACYGIDLSVEIVDRHNLTFDGNGATIRTLTQRPDLPCRANVRVRAGSNIVIRNLSVVGSNDTGFDGPRPDYRGQCQHGFAFDSVQGAQLINSKSLNTWGDPFAIGPESRNIYGYCPPPTAGPEHGPPVPPNRNILVDGFHGFNSGRTVGITHADGVVIQNSYFGDIYDSAIDLETDVDCEWSRNVRILNNRFGRYRYALLAYGGGEPRERAGNFEFSGNVAEVDPVTCYAPVYIRPLSSGFDNPEAKWAEMYGPDNRRAGFVIKNNDLRTLGQGIEVWNSENVTVEGNTVRKDYGAGCANPNVPWYPEAYGVVLHTVKGALVSGNVLVGGPNGGFAGESFTYNSTGVNSGTAVTTTTNSSTDPTTTTTASVPPSTTTTTHGDCNDVVDGEIFEGEAVQFNRDGRVCRALIP